MKENDIGTHVLGKSNDHRAHRHITPQEFGAQGDGVSLDTEAIQAAVDHAAKTGSVLYFPAGRYLTGTVRLRSNLTMEISRQAILTGSADPADYPEIPEPSDPTLKQKEHFLHALLFGDKVENVVITGHGTLDGNGARIYPEWCAAHFPDTPTKHLAPTFRPVLIQLAGARNCEVNGITLTNSGSWTQSYVCCSGLRLEGLTVEAISAWNNDGIDLCDSRDVIIHGCRINCADDGICLKSSSRPVENVVVSDCIVRSSASAIKFGTASAQGFRNITITNISIYDTARSGITLQIVDGGSLEQVTISNITMRNVGNAIYLRIGDRSRGNASHQNAGVLRQVSISNVVAEITGFDSDAAYPLRAPRPNPRPNPLPSIVAGLPGAVIEDVILSNIQLLYRGDLCAAGKVLPPERCAEVPESAGEYPEYDQFGELPAWGFYLRHVRGVVMRDISLRLEGEDLRPAIVAEDAGDLRLEGMNIKGPEGVEPVYIAGSDLHGRNAG